MIDRRGAKDVKKRLEGVSLELRRITRECEEQAPQAPDDVLAELEQIAGQVKALKKICERA